MNRFYACLAVSIIIHMAVLVPFYLMERFGIIAPPGIIKVSLVGSPAVKGQSESEKASRTDFNVTAQEEKPDSKETEKSDYNEEQSDRINEAPVDDPSNKANLSYYGKVKGKIFINYKYPQEAADEGIHGYVKITFIIDSSGRVTSLRVKKSSGYKILDAVSSKAVLDASPFPPRENSIKIEVGFLYVLDN
ncbi:MAG TPA: energy transducer TonB [Desulfomonilia bacterium]